MIIDTHPHIISDNVEKYPISPLGGKRSKWSEKRGSNTARVFTLDGLKIAHMGDTGRRLTEDEIKRLSGLDCLLIPVGGFFTIDAQQAKKIVEQVRPRVVIPMHYRKGGIGFDVIGTVEPFLEGMKNVNYGGSEFVLASDTPEQVLVMTPAAAQE